MIFDTHAHYDDEAFDEDREELLASLREHGIEAVVNVGASIAGTKRTLELTRRWPFFYGAVGVHPNETAELMETIWFVRDTFDMTILLIEHDMKLVSGICEQLTVLNFGQVLCQGPTSQVLSNPEVIKAYLGE